MHWGIIKAESLGNGGSFQEDLNVDYGDEVTYWKVCWQTSNGWFENCLNKRLFESNSELLLVFQKI